MKRTVTLVVALVVIPVLLAAQGFQLRGTTATIANVNANNALKVTQYLGDDATYVASLSTVSYTVVESLLNIESEAARGFSITQFCIQPGSATAAAITTWQLIRSTTASSGGTAISAESTTTHTISRMDPGDATWSGAARTGGTEGTSGAVIDQGTIFVPITATPPSADSVWFCRDYSTTPGKMPYIQAGTTNGVKLMLTATAGGANQAAYIRFVAR